MTAKKMVVPIIIAAAVLIALIVGIIMLSQPDETAATPTPSPTPAATAQTGDESTTGEQVINPFQFARDDVVDIRIKNPKGELHITRQESKYVVEGHEDVSIDRSKVLDPIYIFTNMTLQDEINEEDVTDLATFGLTEPVISATFTTSEGDKRTIHLGNELVDKSGYYMQIEGDSRVFAVWASMYSTLNVNVGSLRDLASFNIKPTTITEVHIDTAKQRLSVIKETNRFSEWIVQGPKYQRMADGTKVAGLLAQLANMKPSEMVSDLDESQLAKYGLDKPSGSIRIVQGGKEMTLTLGSEESIGYLYCAGDAMDAVYKISASLVDFSTFTPFQLSYSYIYLPVKDEVTAITVQWGGKDKTLEKGTDEFEAFYKQFLAIQLFAETQENEKAGEKLGSITFVGHTTKDNQFSPLSDSPRPTALPDLVNTTIEFYEFDKYKTIYRVNGDPGFLMVRPVNMDDLMTTVLGE